MTQTFNFTKSELREFITCCLNAGMIAATSNSNISFVTTFKMPKEIMKFIEEQFMTIRECYTMNPVQVREAIMQEYYRTLKSTKLVRVRIKYVESFVKYCKDHGICPSGGAMTDDNLYQYLYLD